MCTGSGPEGENERIGKRGVYIFAVGMLFLSKGLITEHKLRFMHFFY